tara:strand:- start:3401 stop:3874 length:474 start_codon:yes stop_codon:yes gene_type:complete
MIEVAAAISLATGAFNGLKKGIAVGKELHEMGNQLSQWAGAMADLDFCEHQQKNPPWYKALGGKVEAEAMEIFVAKKKKEQMRKELREWISSSMGPSNWDELVRIEAQVRKRKKEEEYRKIELRQRAIEWTFGIFALLTGIIVLIGVFWYINNKINK